MSGEADLLKLGIDVNVTGEDQAQSILAIIKEIRAELSKPGSSGNFAFSREQARAISQAGVDLNKFIEILNQSRSTSESDINQMIGRFQALGKQVTLTSEESVAAFREEGEALKDNIRLIGNKTLAARQLALVESAIATVERKSGAAIATAAVGQAAEEAGGKVDELGAKGDKAFKVNNFGARQAANGLAVLALSLDATNLTAQGATHAIIQLAFGLAVMSSNARVAVGAGVVAALFTMFEVIKNLDDVTKKENESLKEFTKTESDFVARSQAVNKILADLGNPHNINLGDTFIGVTKQIDDLHSAVNKSREDLRNAFSSPSFTAALRSDVDETAGRVIAFRGEAKALLQQFADGKITNAQFANGLENIGKSFPDFLPEIIQVSQLGATFKAATDDLRKFQAQANQKIAVKQDTAAAFGATPELAQALDIANQRRNAFIAGGPVAVDAIDKEKEALKLADEAWQEYVTTEKGAMFSHIAFRDAYLATGKARTQVLSDLRVETGKAAVSAETATVRMLEAQNNAKNLLTAARDSIHIGAEPGDLQAQKEALEKVNADIAVLQADRIRGEVAAEKVAAEKRTAIRIREIQDDAKLQGNRNALIAAEETKLQEELLKIDREAAAKRAKVDADKAVQAAKFIEQTSLAEIQGREDQSSLELKTQLKSRQITQNQFNQQNLQDALRFSKEINKVQITSLDAQIKARQDEAGKLTKPQDVQAALDDVKNLGLAKEKVNAEARARELKAQGSRRGSKSPSRHTPRAGQERGGVGA